MKLVTGTLYFISEVDVFTSQEFDYYKIGLVKESRKGDSTDRLSEHQTGNPRKLLIKHTVETPAISTLESAMHGLYATSRVFGEWFHLPGAQARKAMGHADRLAQELFAHADAEASATKYAKKASNGRTIKASGEARAQHLLQQQAAFERTALTAVFKAERDFFENLKSSKFDTTLFFNRSSRSKPKFNEKGLEEKYPSLYKKFLVQDVNFTPRFSVSKLKDATFELPRELSKAIQTQVEQLNSLGKSPTFEQVREIHLRHLNFLGFDADAKWRDENAKSVIQSLMKTNESIEGVAKWTRVEKNVVTFDKKSFTAKHPEIVDEFTTYAPVPQFEIVSMRSYPSN
jgi:hypothetical protein